MMSPVQRHPVDGAALCGHRAQDSAQIDDPRACSKGPMREQTVEAARDAHGTDQEIHPQGDQYRWSRNETFPEDERASKGEYRGQDNAEGEMQTLQGREATARYHRVAQARCVRVSHAGSLCDLAHSANRAAGTRCGKVNSSLSGTRPRTSGDTICSSASLSLPRSRPLGLCSRRADGTTIYKSVRTEHDDLQR